MFRRFFLPFLLFALLVVLACERNVHEIGARPKPAGEPKYDVVAHVSAIPGLANIASVAVGGKPPVDGAALYAQHCVACHQANGAGISGAFPPLDGSEWVLDEDTSKMAAIMIYGLQGPITVKGTEYNSAMAPLGATLNDEELAAVATYVRTAWSNKADPVEADVFTDVRDKYGARGMMTVAEFEG